jgi:hypothetical protein
VGEIGVPVITKPFDMLELQRVAREMLAASSIS